VVSFLNVSKSIADGIFAAASSAARNGCRFLKKMEHFNYNYYSAKKHIPNFF